ncbi:basic leucine zipper 23-like [Nicotiana tomentosiformis]|uniref:basic leucine zipper 23-like n=1 Tax=Nicotiana tomentosiformis TaxID=4098 RepID=UPI00051B4288|nr:basic leucine zipper 23-like [Nicotiana tomentosiformis]XP_009624366.1 basic leucine zipper 23-like [Nicotiana tomentosiformis]XP_009624367.1 basic leucine zipper 23-like [Nicotiana tomentosiformis]XP_033516985.1 basic leucine zipper 23-like [Nicotiana tomentosiformis]
MHNRELHFSNQEMGSSSNFGEIPECSSTKRLFNEILSDMHACIHTHTCNPPGPDNSHTHTCYHVHTKVVPPLSDDTAESAENKIGKKRPLSNKEAVRKYREKNKARVASLEDEVVRLRAINQQLLKRLQGQSVLEAEISKLKCLLVDIRGRIEGDIGFFPYQKPMKSGNIYQNLVNPNYPGAYVMNPCNLQCDDQVYCLQPGSGELNGQGLNSCGFQTRQCFLGNQEPKEVTGCAWGYGTPTAEASSGNKRKGGKHEAMASWS